jgi:hypothetical protein
MEKGWERKKGGQKGKTNLLVSTELEVLASLEDHLHLVLAGSALYTRPEEKRNV